MGFDLSGIPDNRKLKTCIQVLIVFGIILEIIALLAAAFMRFWFLKYFEKASIASNVIFFVFVTFTILLIVADALAFRPTWSYCRQAVHIIVLLGFALTAMIVSFSMKELDKQKLKKDDAFTHLVSFWIFVSAFVLRVVLFCFQFWLSLKRTITFRALLFKNKR